MIGRNKNPRRRRGDFGGLWLAAALLIGNLSLTARADDSAARKAIQANYDRISAAFHQGKAEVMETLLAPDATLTTPDHQTWNRDRIVSDFRRQSMMMKNAVWSRKITAFKVHGKEAVATVQGKFHSSFAGPNGQTHVFDLDSLTVDTWVRLGGGWKLKHADTRSLKPRMDGKDLPSGVQGHAGGGHS